MTNDFQTIVLGLGAMGSAAVYQLARRGQSVLGIDQFAPPHARGSTHGDTRITRLAIGEGAYYSPLAIRSHEIWRELEAESGRSLLTVTGGLIISSAATSAANHTPGFFGNTIAAAKQFGIAHEILTADEIRRRFPPFQVSDDEHGYYEPAAGFLRPEECVSAQLAAARRRGAILQTGETVQAFRQEGDRVVVESTHGRYSAGKLIVTAGGWLPALLPPEFRPMFSVTRQLLFWFAPKASIEPFLVGNFPVFIWEPRFAAQALYGFPAIDGPAGGVKMASSAYGPVTTPDTVQREISAEEGGTLYETLVGRGFPSLSSHWVKAVSCLYTLTPDAGFVIDRLPGLSNVFLASPCSGHGFKHSAAIGEALAELVMEGRTRIDLRECTFKKRQRKTPSEIE